MFLLHIRSTEVIGDNRVMPVTMLWPQKATSKCHTWYIAIWENYSWLSKQLWDVFASTRMLYIQGINT